MSSSRVPQKAVLKHFWKFTGNTGVSFLITLQAQRTPGQVLSCEFCEVFFRTTSFAKYFRTTAFEIVILSIFCNFGSLPTNCLSAFALFCELHFVGFALKGLKKYTWSQRTSDAAIRSGKSEEWGHQILIKGGTNKQKNATLQKPKMHGTLSYLHYTKFF